MAWTPGFEHDVFLSYARVDDASASDDPAQGWVAQFFKHLDVALSKKIGRLNTVKVWRDTRQIAGNQLFDDTIRDAIRSSAVFVALTSRGYLESEYCRQELQWFHEHAQHDGLGLAVGDEYRIFNVLMTNIPREEWPAEYGRTSGLEIYDPGDAVDEGEPSPPGSERFGRQLRDIARAVHATLGRVRAAAPAPADQAKRPAAGKISVFLADTSDTLRSLRKRVITELTALPDVAVMENVPPPFEGPEHDEHLRAILPNAHLSVHLLDGLTGREVPEAENQYFPKRQLELAIEHSQSQLIWVPKDLVASSIEDPGYRDFLEDLENGGRQESRSEFQRGLPSAAPGQIIDKIRELRSRAASRPSNAPAAALLDTHFKDQLYALELSQYLIRHNVQPYINPQEDDPRRNLEVFTQRLKQAAFLILFCGSVADEWIRARLAVALQIAIAEDCPLQSCGVYLAPPRDAGTVDKIHVPVVAVEWMDHTRGFNPEIVDRFLEKAGASGGFLARA